MLLSGVSGVVCLAGSCCFVFTDNFALSSSTTPTRLFAASQFVTHWSAHEISKGSMVFCGNCTHMSKHSKESLRKCFLLRRFICLFLSNCPITLASVETAFSLTCTISFMLSFAPSFVICELRLECAVAESVANGQPIKERIERDILCRVSPNWRTEDCCTSASQVRVTRLSNVEVVCLAKSLIAFQSLSLLSQPLPGGLFACKFHSFWMSL